METNPERVARLLLEKGYPLPMFKKKVYDDTDIRDKELNEELYLVREKFDSQRNQEEYSIKFWNETLESIAIMSHRSNIPKETPPLRKYVHNPSKKHSTAISSIKNRIDKCSDYANDMLIAAKRNNFVDLNRTFEKLSNVFGALADDLAHSNTITPTDFLMAVASYTGIVEEMLSKDRFNVKWVKDFYENISALQNSVDVNFRNNPEEFDDEI